MQHELRTDTIAAIATARGLGGIGIIRISGGLALPILRGMFRKRPGGGAVADFQPRLLTHGWVLDVEDKTLDEVMAVYMPGPHSFSGEDSAEIHCHGGRAVLEAVLEAALARGARPAGAGEFTRRAWLNGRLDLSQAEAVNEIIAAPTRQGVYLARNKLAGRLGEELDELRRRVDALRARLLVELDFPDEAEEEAAGEGGAARAEFLERLHGLEASLHGLAQSYERARIWREGALAVLAGEVNVGKSSLLNALLGRRRALVSETPGTTRDFIEESLNLNGLPVRMVDTAGLRRGGDRIEAEGMELARELFGEADLLLLLLDALPADLPAGSPGDSPNCPPADRPCGLSGENAGILQEYRHKIFFVLNKSDLRPGAESPREICGRPALAVSAKTGAGLEELGQAIYREITARSGGLDFERAAPPTLRQRHLLGRAREEIAALAAEYRGGLAPDLLSVRLDATAGLLEEVIGLAGGEDILDAVFSNFCLGK